MLDVIEENARRKKYSYVRMDGNNNDKERQKAISAFSNEKVFLFLLTTRVGGLGLNLAAANKVIVFDPDWNPMADQQATDRALRL